ncbi:MAG: glycosyltransferase [Acidobacteriota bacterium]|nr:glycosyltransferase [Acidobacteriota bacterium]
MAIETEQAPQAVRVSVVVVSHNRIVLLRKCLARLGSAYQVIVADNGSTDGSVQLESDFPHVRFIRIPRNFGLTKALNLGLRSAAGEFVLILHDDTEITPEAVAELAAILESRPEIGAVCPLLVDDDGHPAPQICDLPTSSNPDVSWRPFGGSEDREVACASGAAIMYRNFFLKALRYVDEHYGTFGSNLDLNTQVRRSGKKVLILHRARAVHHAAGEKRDGRVRAQYAADRAAGTAVYLTKYFGFWAGLKFRLAKVFAALGSFRIGELKLLLSGQKVDGTQQ